MIARVAQAAGAAAIVRLMTARGALPDDVAIEAVETGVVLTGPRLALRRLGDVRIRGFALSEGRR